MNLGHRLSKRDAESSRNCRTSRRTADRGAACRDRRSTVMPLPGSASPLDHPMKRSMTRRPEQIATMYTRRASTRFILEVSRSFRRPNALSKIYGRQPQRHPDPAQQRLPVSSRRSNPLRETPRGGIRAGGHAVVPICSRECDRPCGERIQALERESCVCRRADRRLHRHAQAFQASAVLARCSSPRRSSLSTSCRRLYESYIHPITILSAFAVGRRRCAARLDALHYELTGLR